MTHVFLINSLIVPFLSWNQSWSWKNLCLSSTLLLLHHFPTKKTSFCWSHVDGFVSTFFFHQIWCSAQHFVWREIYTSPNWRTSLQQIQHAGPNPVILFGALWSRFLLHPLASKLIDKDVVWLNIFKWHVSKSQMWEVDLLGGFGDLLVLGYQVEFSLMTWKDWQRGLNTLRANNVTLATWRISNGWLSSVARFVGDEMRSPVRWGCVEWTVKYGSSLGVAGHRWKNGDGGRWIVTLKWMVDLMSLWRLRFVFFGGGIVG